MNRNYFLRIFTSSDKEPCEIDGPTLVIASWGHSQRRGRLGACFTNAERPLFGIDLG